MSKRRTFRWTIVFLVLLGVLAACQRGPTTPTPAATDTAVSTTAATSEEVAPAPSEATSEATAVAPTQAPTATATAAPSLANVIDPADIDWPPQVVATAPAAGEQVGLDARIEVRFDQPMDQDSVEAAWGIDPAVSGDFEWPRPDTLIFTPQSALERGENYLVRVADTAVGQNGLALEQPVEFDLQTVGFLAVNQVVPADGADDVQADGAITVVFNKPVVPLVSSDQQAGLPQPLTLDPPVAGTGAWVSTSIYRLEPEEGFAGATTYTVTVEPGLEDVTGSVLEAPFSWQFTTANPSVANIQPPNGASLVVPTSPISITFSIPMETAVTEATVSVTGEGVPPPSFTAAWQDEDRLLVLTPQEPLALETDYTIVVGEGAQAANGNAGLDRETTTRFSTVPFPGVVETQPTEGQTTMPWQRGVFIRFASPMDPGTLEDRIQIEPAPDDVDSFYNEYLDPVNPQNSSFGLSLDFEMEPDAEYTIIIPGDAADPYGNTLGEPFVLRFSTPEQAPVASFNLPPALSQLSTSFPTSVEVIHRNVSELDVRLYDAGLPIELLTNTFLPPDQPLPGNELRSWNIPVETAQDEVVVTPVELADGDALPTGVYAISVTAPEIIPDSQYWQNQRNLLIVADTNLIVKEMPDEVNVWATDLESGAPAPDIEVTLYDRNGRTSGTAVTDGDGFARFDYTPQDDYLGGVLVVGNAPGEAGFSVASSNWSGDLSPWRLGFDYNLGGLAAQYVYLYTDRPIYRPGDTVYFKGILRNNNFSRYTLPEAQSLVLTLDSNFFSESEGSRANIPVSVDAEGIFSGEYVLPEDVALGSYRLSFNDRNIEGDRSFTVAEYRAPEFQVTMTPAQAEALRGTRVDVELQAEYFFGGTPAGLTVDYTIYQDAYAPDIPGPLYAFSDQANFNYEDQGLFGPPRGGTYGIAVTSGMGETDANGRFTINLPADLLQEVEEGSRKVTVEAFVRDLAEFPVASRTAVIFHGAEVYVGVRAVEYAPPAGSEAAVDLRTVDWDGEAVAEQDVDVVFYRREWERSREVQYSMYYTRWEPVDTEVARAAVTTDAQGRAQAGFVPEEGGSYIAVATVTDAGGRSHTSTTYLWVADPEFAGWRSDPRQKSMELIPDQRTYSVGDTARILVQLPFEEPVNAWLTVERGNLVEQRVIRLQGGTEILELPVTLDYAPNVFVSVAAVKPVTPESDFPYADIRLGITELRVSPAPFELDISLTPQETQLGPGDTAVYDIVVRDASGNPVQADLSLALVDLAVLSLVEDNAPPILEAFYSPQPLRSQTGSGLFISGEGLEPEVPLEGGGLGGGGGDGLAQEAVGRLEGEEEDVRREFPDTAYWEARVKTDAGGTAQVSIPLPDTLTTWRLSSKAVTPDTLVGQANVDIISTLPLLIRPVTPRFFTVGDVVQLSAIVNNNTAEEIEATVTLQASGFLENLAAQSVTVPANGRTLVTWWPATVDDVEFADLTFRVEGGGYSDATKPPLGVGADNLIPVYRYDAQDFVGTAGELDEEGRRVEAVVVPPNADTRRGSVEVQLAPSLAAALADALNALERESFDPACASAVVNRLLPNVATRQALAEMALDDPELRNKLEAAIPPDIAALEDLQKSDGGWGWCFSSESDPWISGYVALALLKAQQADYEVNARTLGRAATYLGRQLEDSEDLTAAFEVNRQAFFLYVLAELDEPATEDADALFEEHRDLLDPYAKALLLLAYALEDAAVDNQQTLLADLNSAAIVSATGVHWEDASQDVRNLNSDVRGTAIVIDALTRVDPESALLPSAVRWLMVARNAQIWPTAHETAWSIFALTNWMAVSGELDADYSYLLNVNATPLTEGTFTAENISESEALSVTVASLLPQEPNFFDFQRGAGDGRLYYTLHLNSYIAAETVGATNRGLALQRAYFDAACDPETETCEPIDSIAAGQRVRVELTLVAPNDLVYVIVEDPLPAGAEGIDPNLQTTGADLGGEVVREGEDFPFPFGYWGWWTFNRIEYRDEKVVFYADYLPEGTYHYTYFLEPNIPGEYQVMPSVGYQEFFPEVFGRSDGSRFTITSE